jgi:hypothetical protein
MDQAQPTFLFIEAKGVLTSLSSSWLQPADAPLAARLTPMALHLIEKLCKALGTQIVMAPDPHYQTAGEWRAVFQEKSVDLPVVDVLPSEGDCWPLHQASAYMSTCAPNARWAYLLPDASHAFRAAVTTDEAAGLTVKELLSVAEILAPNSELRFELARLLDAW